MAGFLFYHFTGPARAENASRSYGLAMHGGPKYSAADTHLDYANPQAPSGGTLKQAAIGTFDTLNPYSIKGKAAQGLNLVYDRLMGRVWDEPFTMYPLIAERVDVPEDRSAMTVHINPKARFHDGSAITADDVIFSFHTLHEGGRPNMRRIYDLVKTVEKRDQHTVYFEFGDGYDRETVMILAMMPVLSKAWWEGRTFDQTTLDTPLLNGPYRIKKVDPGRRIVYERVADYWAKDLLVNAGHYNFDEVIFDYYRDDNVALEAFKSGDVNLRREWNVANWAGNYNFPAAQNGDVVLYDPPHERPERARGFIFNMRRAPFDDLNVRKALALAFDDEWVGKNIYYGRYTRINSFFPNSVLSANHDKQAGPAVPLRTRLREADALLKEAGWIVKDGKRVNEDTGTPLTFEILLGAPEDEKVALSYRKTLQKLGVDIRVRVLDAAAFQDRLNIYDFDMVAYHWQNSLSPGTEQMLYWSCESADTPSRWNFSGLCKPEVDEIAAKIANAKTYDELTALTRALDRILLDAHIFIPLFYAGNDYIAYWKPVQHPENVPLYGAVLETWWMDRAKSKNED